MFYYKNYKIVRGEGKSRRAAPVSREQPGQTEQNRVRWKRWIRTATYQASSVPPYQAQ